MHADLVTEAKKDVAPKYSGCFLAYFEQILVALGFPSNPDCPQMIRDVPECEGEGCYSCALRISYYASDTGVHRLTDPYPRYK